MNLTFAKAVDRVAGNALAAACNSWDGIASLVAPPPPPIEDVTGIAVVKFWGIGNWALLRPVIRDLRDRYPRARLAIVTLAANEPLVRDLADDVLLLRPHGYLRLSSDLISGLRKLRRLAPQLSLDFEQFSRAGALLTRAAGIPQRLGFASGARARDGLLTVRVPFRRDVHASRSFRDLAEAAGVSQGPYLPGALAATPAGHSEADRLLGEEGNLLRSAPLVVLHPGSGDNFPGRRWSESGFAAVGRHAVLKHGVRVAITGSHGEAELCERIAAAAGSGVLDACGRLSLEGLVALLSRASALVTNDTGPVHLASALGRPVVALFGPNTPVLYGPLGPHSRALWKALPCSPCLTVANYRSSRCRIHSCMASIATGEVTGALDRILSGSIPWKVADAQAGGEGASCPDAAKR